MQYNAVLTRQKLTASKQWRSAFRKILLPEREKTKTGSTNDSRRILFTWLVFFKTVLQAVGPSPGKCDHVITDRCIVRGHLFRSYVCRTISSLFYYCRV